MLVGIKSVMCFSGLLNVLTTSVLYCALRTLVFDELQTKNYTTLLKYLYHLTNCLKTI